MRATGQMHAADIDSSKRLQHVLGVLSDYAWHGTREIRDAADVCAVNSIIAELRANDFRIETRCVGKGRYEYRLAPRREPQQLALPVAA